MRTKEQNTQYMRKWRKDNPEHFKQYRKDNKVGFKKAKLKHRYGLSYEDWLKIWEIQDGRCKICSKKFKNPSDACIDHNHDTQKIRGLLCRKCNFGISNFNDNPKLTARATEYLLEE